jgi:dynein heavy chain 2
MGGGQQATALDMLDKAARQGDWLCLKNLHLVVAWLPTLEKAVAALAGSMHPDFRLWLTTEPHPLFPPILLQSSLKITFESPPGIKKNMQRTLGSWGKDFIDGSSSGAGMASPGKGSSTSSGGEGKSDGGGGGAAVPPKRRGQLLFLLAWFHAVVQERRSYLPQGWSKAYEFSVGDLRAGTMVLDAVSR